MSFTIVIRLLPVAQEKILADQHSQNRVDRIACLHIIGRFVIRPAIFYTQAVKEIVGSDLPWEPPVRILWPSAVKLHPVLPHFFQSALCAPQTQTHTF